MVTKITMAETSCVINASLAKFNHDLFCCRSICFNRSSAASLLGVDDRVGTIAAGKLADIVAIPGNPLDDIHQTEHVFFVMKEGSVVKYTK